MVLIQRLNKLTKPKLLELLLNTEAIKVKDMLNLFKKLEAYISTARNVSNKHFERFVQTERQCWEKVEYLRHDTLKIAGVPSLVTLTFLRNEVKESDIKLCHRLIEKERTLIKFVNRKNASHILKNKKNSSDLILPSWVFLRVLKSLSTKVCVLITETCEINAKS